MESFLQIANSPIAITFVAGILLYGLNKFYDKNPKWKKYEGSIISAIKMIEKGLPDDSKSKLDAALKYIIGVHGKMSAKKQADIARAKL